MAALSCLRSRKGEGSTKWLPAFEAILEIRYHFTPTDNKLEPIINLMANFPMPPLSSLFSDRQLVSPLVLEPSNRKSRN